MSENPQIIHNNNFDLVQNAFWEIFQATLTWWLWILHATLIGFVNFTKLYFKSFQDWNELWLNNIKSIVLYIDWVHCSFLFITFYSGYRQFTLSRYSGFIVLFPKSQSPSLWVTYLFNSYQCRKFVCHSLSLTMSIMIFHSLSFLTKPEFSLSLPRKSIVHWLYFCHRSMQDYRHIRSYKHNRWYNSSLFIPVTAMGSYSYYCVYILSCLSLKILNGIHKSYNTNVIINTCI